MDIIQKMNKILFISSNRLFFTGNDEISEIKFIYIYIKDNITFKKNKKRVYLV
jgi:hypothetical protein